MPAFSHFFLKRLSARSKFSSSWIMTSDKFYFPPLWRLCAGMGQTVKPRRRRGMGQAKPLLRSASVLIQNCRIISGTSEEVLFGRTLALAEPLTALLRSAQSRVSLVARLTRPARTSSDFPLGSPHDDGPLWRLAHVGLVLLDHQLRHPRIAGRATLGRPATKWGSARAVTSALTRRALRAVRLTGSARSCDSVQGGEGVLGGAPAARARRLGAPARPNGGRARTLPRRGHPRRPTAREFSDRAADKRDDIESSRANR